MVLNTMENIEIKCNICGKNHKTWEHKIYEKAKLAKIGVPLEHLFDAIMTKDGFIVKGEEE